MVLLWIIYQQELLNIYHITRIPGSPFNHRSCSSAHLRLISDSSFLQACSISMLSVVLMFASATDYPCIFCKCCSL